VFDSRVVCSGTADQMELLRLHHIQDGDLPTFWKFQITISGTGHPITSCLILGACVIGEQTTPPTGVFDS